MLQLLTERYIEEGGSWGKGGGAWGSPGSSAGKESACNAGDLGSIPGWGRAPGERMATHSSTLAWRIPWTEEPGGLQSTGLQDLDTTWWLPPEGTCLIMAFFFFFFHKTCYILLPQLGIEPCLLQWKHRVLTWTTREVPRADFILFILIHSQKQIILKLMTCALYIGQSSDCYIRNS